MQTPCLEIPCLAVSYLCKFCVLKFLLTCIQLCCFWQQNSKKLDQHCLWHSHPQTPTTLTAGTWTIRMWSIQTIGMSSIFNLSNTELSQHSGILISPDLQANVFLSVITNLSKMELICFRIAIYSNIEKVNKASGRKILRLNFTVTYLINIAMYL